MTGVPVKKSYWWFLNSAKHRNTSGISIGNLEIVVVEGWLSTRMTSKTMRSQTFPCGLHSPGIQFNQLHWCTRLPYFGISDLDMETTKGNNERVPRWCLFPIDHRQPCPWQQRMRMPLRPEGFWMADRICERLVHPGASWMHRTCGKDMADSALQV